MENTARKEHLILWWVCLQFISSLLHKKLHCHLLLPFLSQTESLKWRKSFGVNDITIDSIHHDLLHDPYLYFKGYGKKGESLCK